MQGDWTWHPFENAPHSGRGIRSLGILIPSQWHIFIALFGYVCPAGEHQSCVAIQRCSKTEAAWKNNALPQLDQCRNVYVQECISERFFFSFFLCAHEITEIFSPLLWFSWDSKFDYRSLRLLAPRFSVTSLLLPASSDTLLGNIQMHGSGFRAGMDHRCISKVLIVKLWSAEWSFVIIEWCNECIRLNSVIYVVSVVLLTLPALCCFFQNNHIFSRAMIKKKKEEEEEEKNHTLYFLDFRGLSVLFTTGHTAPFIQVFLSI